MDSGSLTNNLTNPGIRIPGSDPHPGVACPGPVCRCRCRKTSVVLVHLLSLIIGNRRHFKLNVYINSILFQSVATVVRNWSRSLRTTPTEVRQHHSRQSSLVVPLHYTQQFMDVSRSSLCYCFSYTGCCTHDFVAPSCISQRSCLHVVM